MAVAFRIPNPLIEKKQRPTLTLVPKHRSPIAIVVVVMAMFFGTLFGVVVLRTHMAQQQQIIDDLTYDLLRARNHFDELRAERARLQSPDVLVDAARSMGLVPTAGVRLVDVPPVIAAEVAETLGKVDMELVRPKESPLDTFGRLKAEVSVAP
jgi:cell division protein FtsL